MRETATAAIGLNDAGIVTVRVRKGAVQSVTDARENLALALEATTGRRRPLLVDITESAPIDADARHFYSGKTLEAAFSALALVVEASPLGTIMGNLYFRVARPGIPARLFSNADAALEWLKGYQNE